MAGTSQEIGARERIAVARDPRARAYAQARRHSARVRFYKRVIPLGIAAALAVLMVFTLAGTSGHLEGLSLGPISFSGTKITMESPKMTGFHKDSRPYEVTATSAMQDVRKPHIIELNELKARLVIDDNGTAARLEAATGVFDTQREHLDLRQEVRVATDSGHAARLKSAAIDFKGGTVISREPVTVTLSNGAVEADGLEISDNGKVLSFIGRVRTVFQGSPSDSPASLDASATSSLKESRLEPTHTVTAEGQQMSLRP